MNREIKKQNIETEEIRDRRKHTGQFSNVNCWLDSLKEEYGDESAFLYEKEGETMRISHSQFHREVVTCAAMLNRNYETGAHIGVRCKNTYECFLFLISIIYSGRVAVLLDDVSDETESSEYANGADCCGVLTTEEITTVLKATEVTGETEATGDTKVIGETEDRVKQEKKGDSENRSDQPAIIYFTSGTSGHKSMVLISHYNITCSIEETNQMYRKYRGMNALANLPLYHMYGFMSVIWDISSGGVVIFNTSMKYFSRNIKKYHPVFIETVPLLLEFVYKKVNTQIVKSGRQRKVAMARILCRCLFRIGIDIRKRVFREIHEQLGNQLEIIVSGGAALDPTIITFFHDIGIQILQGYGLTETATFVTVTSEHNTNTRTVGTPMNYNEIRIKEGEIQVRGSNVMLGYYKNEKATKDAFDGEWLKTGDMGSIDRKGRLYVTGRKKNLIILSNGENISPEVIENGLLRSPLVDEVVVSALSGHIHAEIYSEQLRFTDKADAQHTLQSEIDQFNKKQVKSMYVESFTLRKEPFEKTMTMKIIRKLEY